MQKRYRALVLGHYPQGHQGRCDQPLYGKPCETLFKAVQAPVETPEGPVSTLDLWPRSGRRHQLRRHLANMQSPILGAELQFRFPRP